MGAHPLTKKPEDSGYEIDEIWVRDNDEGTKMAAAVEEQGELQSGVFDEDFKDELLYKLDELRKAKFLCDTTVRAQGQEFSAHSIVLSASSDYFKALFSSQLRVREQQNNLVELNEIKSSTIAEVLQFMYTGRTSISSSNAQDLVVASDYLIIPKLKSKAAQFLEGSINASNCLALESFASQYNCDSLKQTAVKYKYEHFVDVVKSEDFLSLGFEKVKELMCKDELNVSEEEQVYEAVMAWVKHDLSTRECFLLDLLKCLRLFSMSKYSLRKIINKEELITENRICTTIINSGLDFFLFPDQFSGRLLKHRTSIEKEEQVIVLNGGLSAEGQLMYDMDCFALSSKKWKKAICKLPDGGEYDYVSAVCGGLLYGMYDPSTIVSCYNPQKNKWKSRETNVCCYEECTFTSFHEELFLIGGKANDHARSDVHKFNPVSNEWKQLASMEAGRYGHCAVCLEDVIYIIAGSDGQACLKSAESYDPSTNLWRKVPDLTNPRKSAAGVTVCGKIFVIGGFQNKENSVLEPTCEIFDPCLNQWSLVSSPHVPRGACGIVCIDEAVYVFGGEDEDDVLSSVEYYNPKCNEWKQVNTPMPSYRTGVQASLLRLPKRFLTK